MIDPVPASVLRTCSQLHPIASEVLARIEAEVAALELPWTENYGAYQSGGWKTVALYNSDGCSQTNDVEDGTPRPTEVAMKLPAVRELIEGSGLALMWARFLLLEPGAYLWEHTDYGAVNLRSTQRLRLHAPLVTNPGAVLVFPSHTVHLSVGHWWKLKADSERHGACNFGTAPRLHLILDCYVDEALRGWLQGESLDPQHVREKPSFSRSRRMALEAEADALLREGHVSEAESVVRRAFHHYALGPTTTYDLLIELFERSGHRERVDHWRDQRPMFLNTNAPGHPFYDGTTE